MIINNMTKHTKFLYLRQMGLSLRWGVFLFGGKDKSPLAPLYQGGNMANKGRGRKKIPPGLPLSRGGACTCFCRATRYNGARFLVCNDVGMTTVEKKQLIASLEKHGFSSEEIQGVLQSYDDEIAGRVYSAEDVYKYLLAKRKVHV